MPVFKKEYHSAIYFFGLVVFAAALPVSKYFMSLAQWLLLLNWLLGGDYREKLNKLWTNKAALVMISLFVLHLIGLIWTTDFQYAFKDIRIKLPLLVLPFIMASENPLPASRFKWVLLVHALAVVASSIYITWNLINNGYNDPRIASSLISHIRFALNVCVAAFSLVYFLFRKDGSQLWQRMIMACFLLWLLAFLFILQSVTGLAIFGAAVFFMMIRELFIPSKKFTKIIAGILLTAIIIVALASGIYIYHHDFRDNPVDKKTLDYFTPHGNAYTQNIHNLQTENGNYLWLYVCYPELMEAWNKRSKIPFDSTDKSKNALQYTLIRFLTSKGYRKDMEGVNMLTEKEIHAIEKGVANTNDLQNPEFTSRIRNVLWEIEDFRHTGDPTDHSLMQRVELWRASLAIIAEHPVIGVGTGDAPDAFENQLAAMNSPLKGSLLRSHNQFLAIAVAFGIPGLLLFLFALLYPPLKSKRFRNYFFFTFFVIGTLSMITEDTLETQAGVSFFIFFFALFLLAYNPETKQAVKE